MNLVAVDYLCTVASKLVSSDRKAKTPGDENTDAHN